MTSLKAERQDSVLSCLIRCPIATCFCLLDCDCYFTVLRDFCQFGTDKLMILRWIIQVVWHVVEGMTDTTLCLAVEISQNNLTGVNLIQ